MRKLFVMVLAVLLLALTAQAVGAQTDTTATSNVTIFFVACETSAVLNFSGTMDPGYDIYYQVFSGSAASGTALTAQRRVEVSGQYAVSDAPAYNSGSTVPAGSTASVRVVIAREGNPASTTYTTTVDDVQDGCANPQNTLITSVEAAAAASAPTGSGIRSPFGGFINNNLNAPPDPIVVIGARQPVFYRSDTPGIIFAECDQYRSRAEPGKLYDNDNIVIFWSWYARTAAQVQDHIDKALYDVQFQRGPLQYINISPIQQIGTNYWVFYWQTIGNLAPGTYGVSFNLSWREQTFDGYDTYGPGGDFDAINSTCTFTIERNPTNAPVSYNLMYTIR